MFKKTNTTRIENIGVPAASGSGDAHESEVERLNKVIASYQEWIQTLTNVVEAGARGDMEQRVLSCDSSDDLRQLADSINRLLDVTDAFVRESGAALSYATKGKYFRRVMSGGLQGAFSDAADSINNATVDMQSQTGKIQNAENNRLELANTFEADVISLTTCVSSAAVQLEETARSLASSATQVTSEATEVNRLSEQATSDVSKAMQATIGLEDTLNTVEKNVTQTTDVSSNAVSKASVANDIVIGLSDDSKRITGVIKMISQVADQTNLLALNATIEAARAGESGKGFAVVASEVKNLANQTGQATQQISSDIQAVQGATANAVDAITSIGETIDSLKSVSESMVQSIDVQKVVSQEIHHAMKLTEEGCVQVTKRIEDVANAAANTNESADQVLQSAGNLLSLADNLQCTAKSFLAGVRQ